MSDSWYVVEVEPRAEEAVTKRARDIAATAYYPSGKHIVRRGRTRVIECGVTKPAMPGYVFVYGSSHFANFRREFDAPDAVPHCLGWLNGPDGPEPVDARVVDDLKQREADGEFDAALREKRYWAPRWLRAGAKVRITAGAFKGVMGEVWRLTKQRRVAIWVTMMGSPKLTECPLECVARVR